ncbi:MAG: ATP-binding protein [Acidobacteriia bacterium]|nr:ATP-binding protein [Terriglobia bacterium]
MSTLKTFTVSRLWGEKDLSLSFHADVNFLIGTNGSGKTTVINLIAAAISADFQTLDRVNFKKIEIQLSGQERAIIEVIKKSERRSPFLGITYRFKPSREAEWKEFSLDDIEGQLHFRDFTRHIRRRPDTGPIESLGIDVPLTWLSIHRTPHIRQRDDKSFESSVDEKLDQLSNALTRLFSGFKSKGDEETEKFQKSLFLALLPPPEWQLVGSVKNLNLAEERTALLEIFEKFDVSEARYASAVQQQFDLASQALLKPGYSNEELMALAAMWSIHRVVQEWATLRMRQAEIYKPREDFLDVINEMLRPRKKLVINERNELNAEMTAGRTVPLRELSSGEKQLIIILGEALLQQRAPWVYIADEPELSLHVTWQEKLTANLRKINPRAQIIFATHSPDIVGRFEDKIFDMEKLLA